jgi:superfamily I DNA/RNA helicase/mRNA-degrading endonuclease RelE of RelBE toxin-antitoxin system
MSTQRLITMKPAFLGGIRALPAKDMQQIMSKIEMLCQDPLPDGKVKKHLTHLKGKPYRIRSGDYRILYTFDAIHISMLTLRKRDEATYKLGVETNDDFELDLMEDLEETSSGFTRATNAGTRSWEHYLSPQESNNRRLPEPLTVELLNKLQVPSACHPRLLTLKTQDELLSCPGIPDDILLRIDQYLFELPLVQIEQQPDLILANIDDLLLYKEGELLSFLLKLSPEQEKYVHWGINATGPTLVKGGPGTGKSTLALYRIRSLLDQLLRTNKTPRLLFTTYTNALVKSSEQQLQQLLGDHAQYVHVQTADTLAYEILQQGGQVKEIASPELQMELLVQAIANIPLQGNALQQQAQRQTLTRIGNDYLLQELNTVIVARQIESLGEYLAMPRIGRKVRLNVTQRRLIWQIYEHWNNLLQATGKETWQVRRVRAVASVTQSTLHQYYDAVAIDEAQDLDPSMLRLLVNLCKAPGRLFITADANQSIYGSGFTWTDVHGSLRFQGRTSVLRANYRSTYEIGEAAQSYLSDSVLDSEISDRHYVNNGPLPDVRAIQNNVHEGQLLANFFKKASLNLRLTHGSCAVLCPSERAGKAIADALRAQGIEATFMSGQDLNLARSGVKVLTLNSAKGLEFPIVALAGFLSGSGGYPVIPHDASADERDEILARERRTMFVGMTRAMRALLVIVPVDVKTPLLQGFDGSYWNMR